MTPSLGLLIILLSDPMGVAVGTNRDERLVELAQELENYAGSPPCRYCLFRSAGWEGFGLEELIAAARADEKRVALEAARQGRALHEVLSRSHGSGEARDFLRHRMLVPHVRERLHQLLGDSTSDARVQEHLTLLSGDLPRRNTSLLIEILSDPQHSPETRDMATRLLAVEVPWFGDEAVGCLLELVVNPWAADDSRRAAVRLLARGARWRPRDARALLTILTEGVEAPRAEIIRTAPRHLPVALAEPVRRTLRDIALDDDATVDARVAALERLAVELETEEHWRLLIGILENRVGQEDLVRALLQRMGRGLAARRALSSFRQGLEHEARGGRSVSPHVMPNAGHLAWWKPKSWVGPMIECRRDGRDREERRRACSWTTHDRPSAFPPAWTRHDCGSPGPSLTESLRDLVVGHLEAEERRFEEPDESIDWRALRRFERELDDYRQGLASIEEELAAIARYSSLFWCR
ncbi:MAG: hypothetical protein AAF533_04965 [Acidobacteriota bacterium]